MCDISSLEVGIDSFCSPNNFFLNEVSQLSTITDSQLQGDITHWTFSILLGFQVPFLMRSPEKDGSELTMNSFPTLGQTMSSRHRTRTIRGVRTCCSIGEYEWFGWLSSNEGVSKLALSFHITC